MNTAYTGHVEPDGDWQQRADGTVRVRKLSVSQMDNNVYVVSCTRTGAGVLIDAADRADRLREAAADVDVLAVLQTHGHWDHIRAMDDLAADPGLPMWGNAGDASLFPAPLDRELVDGDRIAVGDLEVEVLHVPGHTDGSLMFLVAGSDRAHLFSGDTLFPGGPGATFGDRAAHARLMDGLDAVFARLPDETWVYPGHGDDTTLGAERPNLAEWRARGW